MLSVLLSSVSKQTLWHLRLLQYVRWPCEFGVSLQIHYHFQHLSARVAPSQFPFHKGTSPLANGLIYFYRSMLRSPHFQSLQSLDHSCNLPLFGALPSSCL